MRILRFLPILLLLAPAALAHSYKLGAIEIGHPWAQPASGGEGAVFLALANEGSAPDRLIGASTPLAKQVTFRDAAGRTLAGIDLLPHHPVPFRPGGTHLALAGLTRPLALKQRFPLTLRFAKAGSVVVTVFVENNPGD
jgi:periplasmic copper chaperone A